MRRAIFFFFCSPGLPGSGDLGVRDFFSRVSPACLWHPVMNLLFGGEVWGLIHTNAIPWDFFFFGKSCLRMSGARSVPLALLFPHVSVCKRSGKAAIYILLFSMFCWDRPLFFFFLHIFCPPPLFLTLELCIYHFTKKNPPRKKKENPFQNPFCAKKLWEIFFADIPPLII